MVVPDAISFTTHHLQLAYSLTDAVLATATGFIYHRNNVDYLVTCWHNVTGRDPTDGNCLSQSMAVPDVVSTSFRSKTNPAEVHRRSIQLYTDESMTIPNWLQHPTLGAKVDVVVLPLSKELTEDFKLYPINAIEFDGGYNTEVADEAFIVGYPFSQQQMAQLPIWKRASIASEPDLDFDRLPKLLVDTATRPGLSGSPVIMQRIGIHGVVGGKISDNTIIGTIRNFIGVYSGRVGADETKAQLGVVRKATVIDEIVGACPEAPRVAPGFRT